MKAIYLANIVAAACTRPWSHRSILEVQLLAVHSTLTVRALLLPPCYREAAGGVILTCYVCDAASMEKTCSKKNNARRQKKGASRD
jgi:hypothetical protein